MSTTEEHVLALIVVWQGTSPKLIEALSDEEEIQVLERTWNVSQGDPLGYVYDYRTRRMEEDEQFADFLEQILTQPGADFKLKERCVEWFHSKIRVADLKQREEKARKVIQEYAFKVYSEAPARNDFILAGRDANVRVRVFILAKDSLVA